jgi:uncharacterized SAM-binding protein YcdF (DUF218 family)
MQNDYLFCTLLMHRLRRVILATLLLLLIYSVWQLWDIERVGNLDQNEKADCAIVLGAAAWHNKPSPVLKERLNHAIGLYKTDRVRALVLTGGYGKDAPFSESEVALNYCIKEGIPSESIRIETDSGTTQENLEEARKILTNEGWKSFSSVIHGTSSERTRWPRIWALAYPPRPLPLLNFNPSVPEPASSSMSL